MEKFAKPKRPGDLKMAQVYYDPPGPAGPRPVQLVDSRPPVYGATYAYNPTSLAGMIVAIVIMIIAIVVVIWLIQAGVASPIRWWLTELVAGSQFRTSSGLSWRSLF